MNFSSFDNRMSFSFGRTHLSITLGGKLIRYAYIRKNGCSAFKAAIGFPSDTKVSEIKPGHRAGFFGRYDATIFVWRDPEERAISLYRNKIVDRVNGEDILEKFRAFAGDCEPTFEKFMEFSETNADPHCIPQSSYLQPIFYTHAIPLARLHEAMVGIAGANAAQPFARSVNPSERTPVHVSDRARQIIRRHYARDYRMISRLKSTA